MLKNGSNKGFSLVELMVVVAIIGILAAIAIPSVSKYMAKARQSEAKANLSSLYTAEKAFFAEYNAFDSRFGAVGFTPEGQLRYNVGFGAAGFQAGAANGYTTALVAPQTAVSASGYCGADGAMANGCTMLYGTNNVAPAAVQAANVTTSNTFIAGANAFIQTGAAEDRWTINHLKVITNTQSGIQ